MSKLQIRCADGKKLIWANLGDGMADCNSGEDESVKFPCTTPKPLECSNDFDFTTTERVASEKSTNDASAIFSYVTPLITFFIGMFICWVSCTGKKRKVKKIEMKEDSGFMNMEMKNLFKKNFTKILQQIPNDLQKLQSTKKKFHTLMKLKVS